MFGANGQLLQTQNSGTVYFNKPGAYLLQFNFEGWNYVERIVIH